MSTSSQNNGKKSSNSSIVNTPASTPITNINGNAQVNAQNSPPPNNNAPKYGTLVPNRIFVGGISANTTEGELMQLFSSYGTVKAAKIIQDRAGVSKGYGFITFESEDDAKRPLRDSDNIVLKERKLNIAPAIKKQPFSRAFDASSPPAVAAGGPGAQFFFPSGAPMPYFQGGVAYYPQAGGPADPAAQQPVYQPPPVYPAQTGPAQAATYPSMMFPAQTIYMPQQYPMPMPYDYNYYQPGGGGGVGGGPPMYASGGQSGPQQQQCGPGGPPHSPPRPPCYGGGIPYAAADPVFYNLPVYGHPAMDGGPFYEGVEMGPPPAVYNAEEGFGTPVMTDGSAQAPPQDVDHTLTPSSLVYDTVPSAPPLSSLPLATYATDAKQSQQQTTPSVDDHQQRNSDTPVVSLLSIEQQQEKDYTSMQKGRRHKAALPLPPPPPPPHTTPFPPTANGFMPFPPHFHHHHHHHPSVGNFVPFNGHFNGSTSDAYRYGSKMANGVRKKKRTFNDHSSRSSLRTDSNSSASCVDENKNEEKSFRTTVNTPPPPPYSPMANHGQYKIITNTRNYRNNTTTTNNNSRNAANERTRVFNNNNNNNNGFGQQQQQQQQQQKKGQEHEKADVVSNPPCNSQMFAGNQGFVQTLRKGRRCVRRGGPASGNEIGAGDAPLPTGEDVTKKLETLKL